MEGLDRPSIPYRISSSRLLPRNLKGFPSGIDDTRVGEFVNFYRAIETFALSRHSNSCGNLSLNIGGGPCLLSSFFFSSFLNPNIYIYYRGRGSHPSFLLHELRFSPPFLILDESNFSLSICSTNDKSKQLKIVTLLKLYISLLLIKERKLQLSIKPAPLIFDKE